MGQTSRIRSTDGKVAAAKSAQNPATRKPAIAHIAVRYFMGTPPNCNDSTTVSSRSVSCRYQAISRIDRWSLSAIDLLPTTIPRGHIRTTSLLLIGIARFTCLCWCNAPWVQPGCKDVGEEVV